jgi:hypothetical protein
MHAIPPGAEAHTSTRSTQACGTVRTKLQSAAMHTALKHLHPCMHQCCTLLGPGSSSPCTSGSYGSMPPGSQHEEWAHTSEHHPPVLVARQIPSASASQRPPPIPPPIHPPALPNKSKTPRSMPWRCSQVTHRVSQRPQTSAPPNPAPPHCARYVGPLLHSQQLQPLIHPWPRPPKAQRTRQRPPPPPPTSRPCHVGTHRAAPCGSGSGCRATRAPPPSPPVVAERSRM